VKESYGLMLFDNPNQRRTACPPEWLLLNRLQWGLNASWPSSTPPPPGPSTLAELRGPPSVLQPASMDGFYRRPLPAEHIPVSSSEGRGLFREALADGHMERYFPLAEQFHTQADPAFCGLGTLVVALNALAIDPGRVWKGPWRWYGEELLDCCAPLEVVREKGVTMEQLACLARCNGARATVVRASDASVEDLRALLRGEGTGVVAAAYTRKGLGQTGDGHYSPIAGYHAGRDLTLILDVARFKYPPHWVSVERLFEAMKPVDSATGKSRGWVYLERGEAMRTLLFRFGSARRPWDEIVSALMKAIPASGSEADIVRSVIANLPPPLVEAMETQRAVDAEHEHCVAELLTALRATPTYAHAKSALDELQPAWTSKHPYPAELAAALLLALPDTWLKITRPPLAAPLAPEIGTMRQQLEAMREHF
jgi:glutathione gamma-glutamylcysteinyltransferase